MKPIPISKVCPSCQHSEFRKVKAKRWIAFSSDRVCNSCGTRYSPVTPLWAGIVFIVLGGLFLLSGLFILAGALLSLFDGNPAPLGWILAGSLLALGVATLVQGIHATFFVGSV